MKKLPIKELKIDEYSGVEAIALVEFPAIEKNFMKFDKHFDFKFKATNEEEQILTGPALIPDKLIYRMHNDEEFYVFFSKETIKEISLKFFKEDRHKNINVEHSLPVNDMITFESWIIENSNIDKAIALGFEGLPVGTWMISLKILNKNVWDILKESDFNGFSIEGTFIPVEDEPEDAELSLIYEILNSVSEKFYAPGFIKEKTLSKIKPEHLDELYRWFTEPGDDVCPACIEHGKMPPQPLSYWLQTAVPGVRRGSVTGVGVINYNGTQVDGKPFEYGTFCEDACRCKLVRIYTTE